MSTPDGIDLPTAGTHQEVLRDARACRVVRAGAVRQGVMPDHQVARTAGDRKRRQRVEGRVVARVGPGREFGEPSGELRMETGDALKGALIGCGVGQVEDTLKSERDRLRD